jgi:hypothetical protein
MGDGSDGYTDHLVKGSIQTDFCCARNLGFASKRQLFGCGELYIIADFDGRIEGAGQQYDLFRLHTKGLCAVSV